MKYINDFKKLEKINEMAKNGDEQAKDFLFNFMEMDDEAVNDYLSSIAIDVPDENKIDQENINTQQEDVDWKGIVEALIKDENEAIDGYDKAEKYLANSNFVDDVVKTSYLEKIRHIKDEEIEHINELKEIL